MAGLRGNYISAKEVSIFFNCCTVTARRKLRVLAAVNNYKKPHKRYGEIADITRITYQEFADAHRVTIEELERIIIKK